MQYTEEYLEHVVRRFGEVFVVLDSDREYQLHGQESYSVEDGHPDSEKVVRVEGMQGDEWVVSEFPLDSIEHHYSHREV
jgi:hypothetical protein